MTPTPDTARSDTDVPLADPVAEARRVIDAGREQGLAVRVLGGVAVQMHSAAGGPLPARTLKDIDLVTPAGSGGAIGRLLEALDYVGEEMFNALRGSRRQLFHDPVNARDVDVFVGEFQMCHPIPVAERLDRDPYTVPLAELLLTKLQIVQLNERDERDVYALCHAHELGPAGIEAEVIAGLCATDWGLWRTCKGTIERCRADLAGYPLPAPDAAVIDERLAQLWAAIESEPKSGRWKRRSRIGERMRWYEEPEEE